MGSLPSCHDVSAVVAAAVVDLDGDGGVGFQIFVDVMVLVCVSLLQRACRERKSCLCLLGLQKSETNTKEKLSSISQILLGK